MEPTVITGARGPEDRGPGSGPFTPPPNIPTIKPGKTLFQSDHAGLKILLDAQDAVYDTHGRLVARAITKFAEFREGFLELDNVRDAESISALREHPKYGLLFRDWKAVEKQAKKEKAKAIAEALQDPEMRARVMRAVGALRQGEEPDFELPQPQAAAAPAVEPEEPEDAEANEDAEA